MASASNQPAIPPPLSLPSPMPLTPTTSLAFPSPPPSTPFYDDKPVEKFYKKEKQILLEFDQLVKGKIISSRSSSMIHQQIDMKCLLP